MNPHGLKQFYTNATDFKVPGPTSVIVSVFILPLYSVSNTIETMLFVLLSSSECWFSVMFLIVVLGNIPTSDSVSLHRR